MNETISRQGTGTASPSQHYPHRRASGEPLGPTVAAVSLHRSSSKVLKAGLVLKDRYVLESRLGGSCGTAVFKALDRFQRDTARRCIAIKIVQEEGDSRPEHLSSLRREFHRTQSLSHENIVKVYDLDQADGVAFFTMEFIEGRPLSETIKLYSPRHIPRPDAWRIIAGLSDALAHAHSHMVVHGGLKPQNILIARAGGVRILDFSVSRSCGGLRSRFEANSAAIARGYSCWEVLDGRPADPRDDIYALACMSYELLTGAHPFLRRQPDRARHRRMTPERPWGLTGRQWQTLLLGLARDRESRPLSAAEWFAHLDPAQTERSRLRLQPGLAVERTREKHAPPSFIVVPIVGLLALLTVLSSIHTGPPQGRTPVTSVASRRSVPIVAQIRTDSQVSAVPPGAQARPAAQTPAASSAPVSASALVQPHRPEGAASMKTGNFFLPQLAYRVQPRQDFVEIRVRRAPGSTGEERFNWWTEAASAKPGTDFVPQGTVTRFFPKGAQGASLFVKVLPGESRAHPETFYVDVAGSSGDSSSGRVERVAVVLPSAR